MISQRIQWVMAVALMCVLAGPAVAARGGRGPIDDASFDLKSGARLATTDSDNGERIHVRFEGEGQAEISTDGVSLTLGTLTQVDGGRTLTVTPDGDFTRRGRSRVFVGHGTATVDNDGVTTTFEDVRIVVKFRGRGNRLRLIGKFRGKNGPRAEEGLPSRPDVLHGRFRGQRVVAEPDPA